MVATVLVGPDEQTQVVAELSRAGPLRLTVISPCDIVPLAHEALNNRAARLLLEIVYAVADRAPDIRCPCVFCERRQPDLPDIGAFVICHRADFSSDDALLSVACVDCVEHLAGDRFNTELVRRCSLLWNMKLEQVYQHAAGHA